VLASAPGIARNLVCNADCGWYQSIVDHGYDAVPFTTAQQHNWAFFPLFPLLTRLLGGQLLSGLAVSGASTIAAGTILLRETRARNGARAGRWALLFLFYWPFSGVLIAYRPEALALLGIVLAWAAAGRQRWLLAWAGVAIAVAARPTGALAVIFPLSELLGMARLRQRPPAAAFLGAILPVLPIAAFMVDLQFTTGNALAWSGIQVTWGRSALNWGQFAYRYLRTGWFVFGSWDFVAVNVAVLVIGLAGAARWATKRRWSEASFTCASVLISPLTGSVLLSLGRYLSTAITLPLLAATDRRLRPYRATLLAGSSVGLALVGVWMALGSYAAMA
jgi:hypothetical protein